MSKSGLHKIAKHTVVGRTNPGPDEAVRLVELGALIDGFMPYIHAYLDR